MTPLATVALAACLAIEAAEEYVTAGHLAAAWPALASVSPQAPVGLAPLAGARRLFYAGELAGLAKRLGNAGDALATPAPASICVERRVAPPNPETLRAALGRALPAARIELADYSRYPVPDGEMFFDAAHLERSGMWRGYVAYGRSHRSLVWVRVRASIPCTQVEATAALPAGKPIAAEGIRATAGECAPGAPSGPRTLADAIGRLPRRNIPAGTALAAAVLAEPPLVERGAPVRVEVREGSAQLALEAIAEGAGRKGDRIAVRNPESGRRFMARVEGKNLVVAGNARSER